MEGIHSRIGVRIISGSEREEILATRWEFREGCVPFSGMRLSFSAPISRDAAEGISLVRADGKIWEAEKLGSERVESVRFKGPFPPRADFLVKVPADLHDDAGRSLVNENRFPLAVRTDEYPPLAKFSGRFGILEAKANPRLPLTVRKLEADLDFGALGVNRPDILPARMYE